MPRRYKSNKGKRWYVNATVGKNVPLIGGTGIRFGSGSSKAKRSLERQVKSIVKRSVLEPKMYRDTSGYSSLTHNTLYTYNLLSGITQGDDEEHRTGDHIGIKSAHLKLHLMGHSSGTFDPLKFRVMVVKSKVADAQGGWKSAHLGTSAIFWDNPSELLLATICFNQCSALYDNIITISPTAGTTSQPQKIGKFVEIPFKLPSSFVYDEVAGNVGKFANYYVVVIPHQERASTGSTVLGDLQSTTCISFVDSK